MGKNQRIADPKSQHFSRSSTSIDVMYRVYKYPEKINSE